MCSLHSAGENIMLDVINCLFIFKKMKRKNKQIPCQYCESVGITLNLQWSGNRLPKLSVYPVTFAPDVCCAMEQKTTKSRAIFKL